MVRAISAWVIGVFFALAGVNHFIHPQFYQSMMPGYLPWPVALIYISGLAEIVGGLGVLFRPARRIAGWGLILLLLAVFPANIQAALHGMEGVNVEQSILVLRLPFQVVLIAWVYFSCVRNRPAA